MAGFTFPKILSRMLSDSHDVFTTGQTADICGVSMRTVSKWCDAGDIDHYKIPPGNDRRIPRESLIRFLYENRMPQVEYVDYNPVVNIAAVTEDEKLYDALHDELDLAKNKIAIISSFFAFGVHIGQHFPDVVIFDFSEGQKTSLQAAKTIRETDTRYKFSRPTKLYAVNDGDEKMDESEVRTYDGVFTKGRASLSLLIDQIKGCEKSPPNWSKRYEAAKKKTQLRRPDPGAGDSTGPGTDPAPDKNLDGSTGIDQGEKAAVGSQSC